MRKRWLQILILFVLALGIMPMLPAAAQSSCSVSTGGTVRLRAGHSINDAIVGTMPRNTQLQVLERFVEKIGRRTRVWYRLVKEQVTTTAASDQVWVGGSVKTTGDCGNVAGSPTAPVGGTGASNVIGIMPQSGSWTLTYGRNINVSCDGMGSANFATSDQFGQTVFTVNVATSAGGFAFKGVAYTQDANGTWHGSYAPSGVQATGEAYIRVDTPTSMLGDIIVRIADLPGCTFKIPFWAVPQ
jgi:hypothetical protein